MMNKKVEEALNAQINAEMWSAYMYLSMSAYLGEKGMGGMSKWMRLQYQEELTHAEKIMDYIIQNGGHVELQALEKAPTSWNSFIEIFEDSLRHEKAVTQMIENLMNLAIEEKDHATKNMLTWFVDEQVEEESSFTAVVDALKLIQENGVGLYMLDRELGSRKD